jgi:hypothetical protein
MLYESSMESRVAEMVKTEDVSVPQQADGTGKQLPGAGHGAADMQARAAAGNTGQEPGEGRGSHHIHHYSRDRKQINAADATELKSYPIAEGRQCVTECCHDTLQCETDSGLCGSWLLYSSTQLVHKDSGVPWRVCGAGRAVASTPVSRGRCTVAAIRGSTLVRARAVTAVTTGRRRACDKAWAMTACRVVVRRVMWSAEWGGVRVLMKEPHHQIRTPLRCVTCAAA